MEADEVAAALRKVFDRLDADAVSRADGIIAFVQSIDDAAGGERIAHYVGSQLMGYRRYGTGEPDQKLMPPPLPIR